MFFVRRAQPAVLTVSSRLAAAHISNLAVAPAPAAAVLPTPTLSNSMRLCSSTASRRGGGGGFRPFSVEDEAQLVSVLTTKPRHVARHIRQAMLSSRKQTLQFRNAVTFLMIQLQSHLQKGALPAAEASAIVESVMKECVELRQSDMAHLLFRAALRFRKYGLVITHRCVKHLFSSYQSGDARSLMLALADELKGDPAMRSMALSAMVFGGNVDEAITWLKSISLLELTTEDLVAFLDGCGSQRRYPLVETLFSDFLSLAQSQGLPQVDFRVVASTALCAARGDYPIMGSIYRKTLAASKVCHPLTDAAVGHVFRAATSELQQMGDVYEMEAKLKLEMGLETLGLAAQTALIAKCSDLVARGQASGDEIMLVKVQHLQAIIESSLAAADADHSDPFDVLDQQYIFSMIKGFGILGRVEDMKAAFECLKKGGVTVSDHRVYDEMLRWYAYANNVKEVMAVKEEMSKLNVYHTTATYLHVFRVLDRHYPRMVEKYVQEMKDRGIYLDAPLYAVLIRVFSEIGQDAKVYELYTELKQRILSPNQRHLFTPQVTVQLLRALHRDAATSKQVIQEAKNFGHFSSYHVQAEVIRYYTKINETAEAARLIQNLPEKSAPVFRVLLRDAWERSQKDTFLRLFHEWRASGVRLTDSLFTAIVGGLSHFEELDLVKTMIEEAKTTDVVRQASFFAVSAAAFARADDWSAVQTCWDELVASKLSISMAVFNRFLELFMSRGLLDSVQEVLNAMMQSVPPNPITATTVVDMLGKMGRLNEMEAVLEDMSKSKNASPTMVTFHQAMNAFAKAGDIHKMESIRNQMQQRGIAENHVTYNILADGYGRAKRLEHVKDLIEERKAKRIAMEVFGYVILLNIYAQAKMLDHIQAVVSDIQRDSSIVMSPQLQLAIARAFASVGEVQAAEPFVTDLLASPTRTQRIVEAVFLLYCRLRDVRRLQQLLEDASIEKTEFVFNCCITTFARAGEHTKVALLLQQLEQEGMFLHRNTAVTLSSILLKSGKLQLAQAVLQMKTVSPGSGSKQRSHNQSSQPTKSVSNDGTATGTLVGSSVENSVHADVAEASASRPPTGKSDDEFDVMVTDDFDLHSASVPATGKRHATTDPVDDFAMFDE